MDFDRNSEIPLYAQLVEHIKNLIRYGYMPVGKRVSVQRLADEYKLTRGVVQYALDILKSEGYMEARPKVGTFVSANAWTVLADKAPDWRKYSERGHRKSSEELYLQISLRSKNPSINNVASYGFYQPDFDPYGILGEAMNILHKDNLVSGFNYNDSQGLPELRGAICEHMKSYGITGTADNVVVFNSWREACNAVIESFASHGTNFYIAEHDMIGAMHTLSAVGANVYRLPTDSEGIDANALASKALGKTNNILCLNPVNHFPTGVTISDRRRAELLSVIRRLRIPVIEYDMVRDLWLSPPPAPLKADDSDEQIIYIGALANTHSTASKMAWIIAPSPTVMKLYDVKVQRSGTINALLETLTYLMLSRGLYQEYMKQIRYRLPKRINAIKEILNHYLTDIATWDEKTLLYHIWITFPNHINAIQLFLDCPDVYFVPGLAYHHNSAILLNAVCSSVEAFETAVQKIAQAVKLQTK